MLTLSLTAELFSCRLTARTAWKSRPCSLLCLPREICIARWRRDPQRYRKPRVVAGRGLEQVGGRPPTFPSLHPSQRRAADSQGAAELSGAARQPSPVRRRGGRRGSLFAMRNLLFCGGFFKNSAFIRCASDSPTGRCWRSRSRVAPRTPPTGSKISHVALCSGDSAQASCRWPRSPRRPYGYIAVALGAGQGVLVHAGAKQMHSLTYAAT